MFIHLLNPTILKIGFIEIRWYSIMYLLGLAIGYYLIKKVAREWNLKLGQEDVMDYIVYLAMGILIGGRFFYFVFYDSKSLFGDPLELFKLWHGGMSFHGGVIGTITAAYIFARKKKLDFWKLADITVIPLGLGLALGRIGNFINGELFGRPWDGFLCIDYTHNPHTNFLPKLCRYPSQILESLKNLLIFGVIYSIRNIKLPKGFLFWTFITMYGILRFCVEFIRQPDPQLGFFFGWMTMGQILSSSMIFFGITMLIILWRKK